MGANLTKPLWDPRRRSPLSDAADRGDFGEVRRLIKEGANPSEPDASENTPIYLASRSYKMVELLLQLGADPRICPCVYIGPITELCSPSSPLGQLLARYGYEAVAESGPLDDVTEDS
jgi:hypothetical protein